jgi:hypothetical protein
MGVRAKSRRSSSTAAPSVAEDGAMAGRRAWIHRYRVAAAASCAAVAIGCLAIVDHHVKQARMNRAEVAEWYCAHRSSRCGRRSSAGIEARWNRREVAYEALVATFAVSAGLAVVRRRRLLRTRRAGHGT